MYSPLEMEKILSSMVILVDTREQPNKLFEKRVAQFQSPWARHKLDFGDYSVKYTGLDGCSVYMDNCVAVERKMDANELAACFTRERKRFEREFLRAKEHGARIYLLVECEDWEKIYAGKYGSCAAYRSKMNPQSLTASIHAWQARYGFHLHFCQPDITGVLIENILKYELRERLEHEHDGREDH